MVSAGLDTVPGNLIMGIAYLSSPHGQKIQARAHAEILAAYPNNDAWHACLVEEKIPYITALYKEILRYFTVIPLALPRTSIRDMEYDGKFVPAGTTAYLNAWACNHGEWSSERAGDLASSVIDISVPPARPRPRTVV